MGEGPGEFGDAFTMTVLSDGRVVVADLARRGYHLFRADGEFDRMVRVPGVAALWRLGAIKAQPGAEAIVPCAGPGDHAHHDGRRVFRPESSCRLRTASSARSSRGKRPRATRSPRPGCRRPAWRRRTRSRSETTSNMPYVFLPQFSPRVHWDMLPDGSVAFADSTTWTRQDRRGGLGRRPNSDAPLPAGTDGGPRHPCREGPAPEETGGERGAGRRSARKT